MNLEIDYIYTERNMCVALIARMALALGLQAGKAEDPNEDEEYNTLCIIDLPSGQISWHIHRSEAHLVADLPPYPGEIEEGSSETTTKYDRMMTPGKLPYLGETVVCTQHGEATVFPLQSTKTHTTVEPPRFLPFHPTNEA